ncbi:hormone-sensitive lipase-like, partial [Brachionus plicatilis]
NDTVRIRILSGEVRQGMLDTISPNSAAPIGLSKNLILHVHGGGFIAHSSKSHEIYLKPWCKELKVPIVSIDYSLAPEHVFPRASEECFYVYAWCLLNKNLLGWSGENIICVGDSAGGVLATNIVQRAIVNQIRIPDALVPIYSPFLLTYSLSPSRLLSVMDPLLNLGILWRCLAAYSGIDFKAETERYKIMLNLGEIKKIDEKNSNVRFSKSESIDLPDEVKIGSQEKVKISLENLDNRIDLADVQPEFQSDKLLTNEELLSYYELMGDAIFLIDKLRSNRVPYDHYMSPILSTDDMLSKFPKTFLISACLDPLHDDSIEFKRRLNRLHVPNGLEVIEGVHHGFLNFVQISKECRKASKLVTSRIKSYLI